MISTTAAPSTRRAPHSPAGHAHRVTHLVAGTFAELPEIEALLATLPMCATGRVFVEVDTADQVGMLSAPSRMVVSWLVRADRTGAPGTGRACAPGEALSRAVQAWAAEMLCAETIETVDIADAAEISGRDAAARVWLSGPYTAVADCFDYLTESLSLPASAVDTPARFGLRR
ncbi:NADPH-dependent ferric siderophore reductase [Mycetocola sp. BIGb0189]|uniref:SIP domain-containing protein n=1 Tax=Mycetocola sp. BIGb0189 TaxID=2940604 RepID=UPI002168E75C|nr:SIP domain-containing protein [Mycetocola sp. BIGb0189]MCS4274868.1 NADPH-dependent ferric siderophore reductase [Mycetocola sp. BIGb0189]